MRRMNTSTLTQQSEAAFRDIYARVLRQGKLVSPRGALVREVENFTYELPAYARFPSFESRKFKLDYVKRELLWYLRGNPADLSITEHAAIWKDMVDTHSKTINSNYGQYIFKGREGYWGDERNFRGESQFGYVVKSLLNDKDSRRASFTILNSGHTLNGHTKDYPCTYSLNFRIRDNKLNMSVHMRSQDAIFGMGNDAPAFSFMQEMVYVSLLEAYPTLEMGSYFHTTDSFHVYERHFKMLEEIVDGSPYIGIEVPRIASSAEVEHLLTTVHLTYPEGKNLWCYENLKLAYDSLSVLGHLLNSGVKHPYDFSYIEGPFTHWLTSIVRNPT